MLLSREKSQLLVVDIQEGLLPVTHNPRQVLRGARQLILGAGRLNVPVTVSEQYPQGIGHTMGELLELLPDGSKVLEKMHFSCAFDQGIRDHVTSMDRPQVVICGTEAHVCVLQTALGFKEMGLNPVVVVDACASRLESNHSLAMERMRHAGVETVSAEMVLFEWAYVSGTPEFKDILKLVK